MDETAIGGERRRFATTLWTEVLRAGDPDSPHRKEALESLIAAYWKPLYALVRRRGLRVEEAKDSVQEFFARLLEKDWLSAADPNRGRFRTFLRTAVTRFLANEWDRERAAKRGGDRTILSLDFDGEESRLDPADPKSPEDQFDREWALTVLHRALDRLEDQPRGLLRATMGAETPSMSDLAVRFGLKEQDVKNLLFRARQRLRALMIEEVASQVEDPKDAESELQDLWKALR